MALLQRTRHELKETGSDASIPDNNIAKLMYYLNCICSLLDLDLEDKPEIRRATDYKNYHRLNDDEIDKLLVLCILLSPDELEGKCIFQDDDLCGDCNNNFFKISEIKTSLLVSRSVLVGGESTEVQNIMVYKSRWMIEHYIGPIASFHRRLQRISNSLQSGNGNPSRRALPAPSRLQSTDSSSSNCCCVIL